MVKKLRRAAVKDPGKCLRPHLKKLAGKQKSLAIVFVLHNQCSNKNNSFPPLPKSTSKKTPLSVCLPVSSRLQGLLLPLFSASPFFITFTPCRKKWLGKIEGGKVSYQTCSVRRVGGRRVDLAVDTEVIGQLRGGRVPRGRQRWIVWRAIGASSCKRQKETNISQI